MKDSSRFVASDRSLKEEFPSLYAKCFWVNHLIFKKKNNYIRNVLDEGHLSIEKEILATYLGTENYNIDVTTEKFKIGDDNFKISDCFENMAEKLKH